MKAKIPEFLNAMLQEQYGKQITEKILQGYQTKRNTTFRVNTLKGNVSEIEDILKKQNIAYEKVEWSKEAFILKNVSEKEIKNLAIYQEGKIYLQSLSSMLPPLIMQPQEGTEDRKSVV